MHLTIFPIVLKETGFLSTLKTLNGSWISTFSKNWISWNFRKTLKTSSCLVIFRLHSILKINWFKSFQNGGLPLRFLLAPKVWSLLAECVNRILGNGKMSGDEYGFVAKFWIPNLFWERTKSKSKFRGICFSPKFLSRRW